jgi:hypothetical protein|tara:strand:+ start:185 stop:418 length:234 start_codon:yes stop_codon:yes gene_type:complete
MHVTLQINFGRLLFDVHKFIADTVPNPIAHAYPTKFMATRGTSHVLTSLIFFNVDFAFWACFCIGHDPCNCGNGFAQ